METVLSRLASMPAIPISIKMGGIWLAITVIRWIMKVINGILLLLSIMNINCFFHNHGSLRNWDDSLVSLNYIRWKHAELHEKKVKVKIKSLKHEIKYQTITGQES